MLVFVIPDEAVLFWGWTAFNVYAAVVLAFAYRARETWSWILTWVLVAPYALMILYDSEIGPYYFGAAVIMTIAQFMTRRDFYK